MPTNTSVHVLKAEPLVRPQERVCRRLRRLRLQQVCEGGGGGVQEGLLQGVRQRRGGVLPAGGVTRGDGGPGVH